MTMALLYQRQGQPEFPFQQYQSLNSVPYVCIKIILYEVGSSVYVSMIPVDGSQAGDLPSKGNCLCCWPKV